MANSTDTANLLPTKPLLAHRFTISGNRRDSAVGGHLSHTLIPPVGDKDITREVYSDAARGIETSIQSGTAVATETWDRRLVEAGVVAFADSGEARDDPFGVDLTHAVVACIRDIKRSVRINCYRIWNRAQRGP